MSNACVAALVTSVPHSGEVYPLKQGLQESVKAMENAQIAGKITVYNTKYVERNVLTDVASGSSTIERIMDVLASVKTILALKIPALK